MWKPRPDEKSTTTIPPQAVLTQPNTFFANSGKDSPPATTVKPIEPFRTDLAAHLGKGVLVKGELCGSEDLYLDGEVEGRIDLGGHALIIGPNGRVRANVSAREIVLHGRVDGNVTCSERVELKRSCTLTGDIISRRIVIEDGAFFKGVVDLQRDSPEPRKAMAVAAGTNVAPVAPAVLQTPLLEHA
jgi:cytoskeletal protein CcmA (bactofilin family)